MIHSESILICIAVPILITLFFTKGASRRYALFFIMGMGLCLLTAYISGFIDQLCGKDNEWTVVYVSPVVEESMKMLPLLFYMILTDPDDSKMFSSGVALAAGFATFENCCFLLASETAGLTVILVRGMAVGVMHVVSIMVLCLGLILIRKLLPVSVPGIVGALSFSMTFHSLYNLLVSVPGISTYIGYVLPIVTGIFVWILFQRMVGTSKQDVLWQRER